VQRMFSDFTTLFVVVDPIATLPLFIALTTGMAAARRRRIAVFGSLVAFLILMAFLAGGQFLLEALHIRVPSFQLAGSIILFLFAVTLVFDIDLEGGDAERADASDIERAIFPLAIPIIASPGAMLAVVLLTDNDRFSVLDQARTAGMLVVVMVITLGVLLLSQPILRIIRKPGTIIVSRVMGLILASLAVDNAVRAIAALVGSA
jgi:multiple antibiotic resistance protein